MTVMNMIAWLWTNATYVALFLGVVYMCLHNFRVKRTERCYDGVPKIITESVEKINNGLIPAFMGDALRSQLPEREKYELSAEAMPIFPHKHDYDPIWCVRINAKGVGIDSGFDTLINRHGEIVS